MRITCPHCGQRDISEFTYLGDGSIRTLALGFGGPDAPPDAEIDAAHDAVFLRDNPRGHHRELWYHALGCRQWVDVVRNTATHDVISTRAAAAAHVELER
ncbi:MAG: sarcosine oxidase subunit delta [Pseudomonadota bacterium]